MGSVARRALAVLLGSLAAPAAGAAGFAGALGASSDNVFRGISESDGDPSVQAEVHYAWDAGAFAGLRGASITTRAPYRSDDTIQLDAFAGYAFGWGDAWDARALLVHYDYPWSDPRRRGYDEVALQATWLGRVTAAIAASPNHPAADDRRRTAYDYELAVRWPIARALAVDAGVGYYDLSRAYDVAYAYWSAGASCTWRRATLGLAWIGADSEARSGYGELADDRVVGSVLWAF